MGKESYSFPTTTRANWGKPRHQPVSKRQTRTNDAEHKKDTWLKIRQWPINADIDYVMLLNDLQNWYGNVYPPCEGQKHTTAGKMRISCPSCKGECNDIHLFLKCPTSVQAWKHVEDFWTSLQDKYPYLKNYRVKKSFKLFGPPMVSTKNSIEQHIYIHF